MSLSLTAADHAPASTLCVDRLAMSYGAQRILHDLTLDLPAGRVTAIVGPNGCGKSTLLAGMARLHRPDAGGVYLNGQNVAAFGARAFARELALLPQQVSAPEGLTVAELIQFGRQPHQRWYRQWSAEDRRVVDEALGLADLHGLADRPLEAMSGGQRQRAWIAMTIAQQTPVVLLDEPTTALDLGHAIEVFELIRGLAGARRTVVMVLHDLINACRFADHLVAMKDGQVLAAGPPIDIVTPDLVRALYDIDCDLITDPSTATPVMVNIRRARPPA